MGLDRRLIELTRGTRKWIVAAIGLGWLIVALNVAQVSIIGRVIGEALEGQLRLEWLLLMFVGIVPLRAGLNWAARLASHRSAGQTKLLLRDRLYTHLLDLGPGYLESERTGALVHTAVEGVEALEVYFGQYLPQFVLGVSIPILLCGYIATMDWMTAAALLVTLPLIPASLMVIQRKLRNVSEQYWTSAGKLSAQFLDSIQGLTTLKMFNRGKARAEEMQGQAERLRQDTMRLLSINLISLFFIDWVSTLGTTVVACGMAAWRLQTGAITYSEAVMLTLLSLEMARPLILLGSYFHAGASGAAAAQRIFEILDIQPQVQEAPDAVSPVINTPHIRFEHVCLAYDNGERPALEDVSFEIHPGEMVALVGASGAGKSSVVNLLFRFFDPQKGIISLGGNRLSYLSLDWLRRQMALVAQDAYLFHGTVAENLCLAKPEATQAELKAAARMTSVHDLIEALPEGYATQVGEHGLSLSGGQVQCIAIARAVLKDAPIVILDEATSQVDAESEAVIQRALKRLMKDRTVLVIAHRLSTVRRAKRILMLDKGHIVESGTHEELLCRQGAYASLVSAQIQAGRGRKAEASRQMAKDRGRG